MRVSSRYVAGRIDHTFLKIDVDMTSLENFVREGIEYGVRALVVTPSNVRIVKNLAYKTDIRVVSVIAFPFGQTSLDTKIDEIGFCVDEGVDEIDIVLNTAVLKMGNIEHFREEARNISIFMRSEYPDIIVKYIVEVTILSNELIRKAVEAVNIAKPHYFKTSTGFGPRGTTPEDVRFIRKILLPEIRIKASGGIRTLDQFLSLIDAGADIIGSSKGVEIVKEAIERSEGQDT